MTGQPPRPAAADDPVQPSARPSFTSEPSGHGRAYQTGGNQSIHEHHHYAPATPPVPPHRPMRAAVTWSLITAVVLALGAVVGVDLWQRNTGKDADPTARAGSQPTTAASSSPAPADASPDPTRPTSPEPKGAEPTPSREDPSRPPEGAAPNPAQGRCGPWKTTDVTGVQARACGRVDDGRLYMIGEWRSTSGSAELDLYLWLRDSTGKETIYPDTGSAKQFTSLSASSAPGTAEQWREWEVRKDLVHGAKYEVCVSVYPPGSNRPSITNANVSGYQYGLVYP